MIAVVGWIIAALAVGLWWGERGRRLDAQRREGVLVVDRPRAAVVTPPASLTPASVTHDMLDARAGYIESTGAEGYDLIAAAVDFDEMIATVNSDTAGVVDA